MACYLWLIWRSPYRFATAFPELPLVTLMDLSLHKLLIPPGENHWTLKHKFFLSDQFFFFYANENRLRLRVTGDIHDILVYVNCRIKIFCRLVSSKSTIAFGPIFLKIYPLWVNGLVGLPYGNDVAHKIYGNIFSLPLLFRWNIPPPSGRLRYTQMLVLCTFVVSPTVFLLKRFFSSMV